MEREVKDQNSNLKWKAIDCLVLVIEKQGKTEKMKEKLGQEKKKVNTRCQG